MEHQYKAVAFTPVVKGCGAKDGGWDTGRCEQFQSFLNAESSGGWKLHSTEYRQVTLRGCSGEKGNQLICIFEK